MDFGAPQRHVSRVNDHSDASHFSTLLSFSHTVGPFSRHELISKDASAPCTLKRARYNWVTNLNLVTPITCNCLRLQAPLCSETVCLQSPLNKVPMITLYNYRTVWKPARSWHHDKHTNIPYTTNAYTGESSSAVYWSCRGSFELAQRNIVKK